MNTNQFEYLAALCLHNGQMTTGDLLQYMSAGEPTDADMLPARKDLEGLVAHGLVELENTGGGWRTIQLTLTEIGSKIADFLATVKMEQMIQECYNFFAPRPAAMPAMGV